MTMQPKSRDELDELAREIQADANVAEDIKARAKAKVEEEMTDQPGNPAIDPEAKPDDGEEYDIFKVIVDSIMTVIQDPTVKRAFASLKDKFNRLGSGDATAETGDISKELIEVISMTTSYSVVMSINYYDQQLKRALSRDFNDVSEVLTKIESDLLATTMKVCSLEKLIASSTVTPEA